MSALEDLVRKVSTLEKTLNAYITQDRVSRSLSIGWIKSAYTWVYVSSTSFKIVGVDIRSSFPVGTKIWLYQSGNKYFYVISAAMSGSDTLITVSAGSDYTIANAAIIDPYYSYMLNPVGFPSKFNYTVSWIGSGSNPAIVNGTLTGVFWMNDAEVHQFAQIDVGSSTTWGSGILSIGFAAGAPSFRFPGTINMLDTSAGTRYVGSCEAAGAHTLYASTGAAVSGTVPFTWATGDRLTMQTVYKI